MVRSGRAIRLFRLLRILRLLRIFRIFKLISFVWKGMHTISELFDLLKRTFTYSFILLIGGAFIISYLEYEQGVKGINSYRKVYGGPSMQL